MGTKKKQQSYRELVQSAENSATERKRLFDDLCRHVSQGYSKECYSGLDSKTLNRFFKDFPDQFDKELYEIACLKGRLYWENLGKRQSDGSCLGNSRAWQYNMINRYHWTDKVEIKAEHSGAVSVNIVNYASHKASKDAPKQD